MRFRLLAFVALVLGMVSCQQDFEFVNGVGDEVNFQLSVSAEELATRAGEDGSADDQSAADSAYGAIDYLQGVAANDAMRLDWSEVNLRYTLEVYNYNANGDYSQPVLVKDRQVIIVDEYAPATFDMRLIANRQYHFVVFADFVPQSVTNDTQNKSYEAQAELGLHHTIGTTLAEITVKNDDINNEATDAYFVATDITVANTSAYNVILKRPYGKLRVVATDLAELNLNVDPAKVVVSYDAAHPTKFNAITGSIDFEQSTVTTSFTSEYNAAIGKNSLADHFYTAGYDDKSLYYTVNDNGVERHTHMTLFTDYILAEEDQDGVHFTITTYDGDGAVIKEVEFATEIPVQRNYLTTIVGNVLTTATQVEVMINDNFDGEIPVGYYENNEIHYTATSKVTPAYPDRFGGATIIANEWDANTGEGIITFNRDITEIGDHAFEYCNNLISIIIPNQVTKLGSWAFANCSNLTSATIGSRVVSISDRVFRDCPKLSEIKGRYATKDGKSLIINNTLVAIAPAGLTTYTIPAGVTKIEGGTFGDCTKLVNITIPNSVKTIGDHAFTNCASIIEIVIPEGVTHINNNAFYSCSRLTSVTIPDSATTIGSNAFAYCKSLTEFKGSRNISADGRCVIINGKLCVFAPAGITTYDIPTGVTTIGSNAFNNSALVNVKISDSVTTIEQNAFNNSLNLTSITIPNSVVTIGKDMFCGCTKLAEFKGKFASADGLCLIQGDVLKAYAIGCTNPEFIIPDGITTIEWGSFHYSEHLVSVTIPASVTRIDDYGFVSARKLTNVFCQPTTPPVLNGESFNNNAAGRKIYVPRGSGAAYKAANNWSKYAADIVEYDF